MLLIVILTLVLHAQARRCTLSSGWLDVWNNKYSEDCAMAALRPDKIPGPQSNWTRNEKLAVCLVERNSLEQILQCGFEDYSKKMYFRTTEGGVADGLDLTDNTHHDSDDGRVFVTPKDILLTAARSCESDQVSVSNLIEQCPYYTLQEFKSCLCCKGVTQEDLENLDDCLRKSWRVVKAHKSIKNFRYSCAASCPYGERGADGTYQEYYVKNGYEVHGPSAYKLAGDNQKSIYTFTGTIFSSALSQTTPAPSLTMPKYDTRPVNPVDATPTTSVPDYQIEDVTDAPLSANPTGASAGARAVPASVLQLAIGIILTLI